MGVILWLSYGYVVVIIWYQYYFSPSLGAFRVLLGCRKTERVTNSNHLNPFSKKEICISLMYSLLIEFRKNRGKNAFFY